MNLGIMRPSVSTEPRYRLPKVQVVRLKADNAGKDSEATDVVSYSGRRFEAPNKSELGA